MRIDSANGNIIWAKKFGQKKFDSQQVVKSVIYNDTIIWTVSRLITRNLNTDGVIDSSIARISSDGDLLQFMSVWTVFLDPQFEINNFYVFSNTEIIIISASNSTYGTGISDIGISKILSNISWEWHYTLDINNYNDKPKDIIIYDNYTYILSYNDLYTVVYFLKFNHIIQKLIDFKIYQYNDGSSSYLNLFF